MYIFCNPVSHYLQPHLGFENLGLEFRVWLHG